MAGRSVSVPGADVDHPWWNNGSRVYRCAVASWRLFGNEQLESEVSEVDTMQLDLLCQLLRETLRAVGAGRRRAPGRVSGVLLHDHTILSGHDIVVQ